MSVLHVALIQSTIYWEDAAQNRIMYEEKIKSIQEAQLIILPETFNTGFSMQAKKTAETMDGDTVTWMQRIASEKNVILCGSMFIREDEHIYNRLLWVLPSKQIGYYNKRHLFSLAKENVSYTAGEQRVIAQVNGFKINLQVCYDLRFPVWSRQQSEDEYDVLLYVANWPEPRIEAWKTLLRARAIENQCYVLGVNRVGTDGMGIHYKGASSIIDPMGHVITCKDQGEEEILIQTLDKKRISETRTTFPFLKDKDSFTIL